MVWRIARKELLVNLLSLRFAIGLMIAAGMMGIVGYVLLQDYVARQQTYLADVQRHQEELEQTKVYSMIGVSVDIPPSPLSIFSRGAKDLPASFKVSAFQLPSLAGTEMGGYSIALWGNSTRPYNPLLRLFNAIDLSFVISTILSLLAVLLVFDSFSGEREQGTLPLIMACPVGRLEVLAGKFLGGLITIAVPLTAVVIPEGGGYLAQYARPQESRRQVVEGMERADKEFYDARDRIKYEQKGTWNYANTDDFSGDSILSTTEEEVYNRVEYYKQAFPLQVRRVEEIQRTAERYEVALKRWGRLRDALIISSLCSLYQRLAQAMTGTDVETYEEVLQQARRYRTQLVDYLRPKAETPEWFTRLREHPELLITEENQARWEKIRREEGERAVEKKVFTWEPITPLGLRALPRPHIAHPGLGERVERVAGLLTYRSIAGELQDGTLALVFSNPVSRFAVLMGKYLASLLALGMALAISMVFSLLVLQLTGAVHLQGDDWLKIAFVGVVSLLYLSCFVLIGQCCSILGRNPTIAAVAFLFSWTLLVFVVPNLGGMAAGQMGKTKTPRQVREIAEAIPDQIVLSAGMSPEEEAAIKRERELAQERLLRDYIRELVHQVSLGQDLTRISPTSIFTYAVEEVTGDGIGRFVRQDVAPGTVL